jgi:DNA-binding CsgD family transcriptional regulator
MLAAARGDLAAASRALGRALRDHSRVDQPFERARTLLLYGRVLRRDRQKRAAREALREARTVFRALGAPLWAAKAEEEEGRIGGRAPAPLALTPTETRVADLAAAGRTNREIADALFMSVHTVEWNLSKVYRKLGIRSRTELAARLPGDAEGP